MLRLRGEWVRGRGKAERAPPTPCQRQPFPPFLAPQDCLSGFASGSFFELEGRPYCETHFHQRQGSVCHGCGRPVTGRCVTAAGRKYHPEHFICAYCLGQLHKGSFRERGDKMYCQACHDKLFL